ncbi:hypothetical protein ANTQUA_LOCUS983 [Anthophora quadrimaculata]
MVHASESGSKLARANTIGRARTAESAYNKPWRESETKTGLARNKNSLGSSSRVISFSLYVYEFSYNTISFRSPLHPPAPEKQVSIVGPSQDSQPLILNPLAARIRWQAPIYRS